MKPSPSKPEAPGQIAQQDDAGDDGRRRQHDADLERGRRKLVVMVLREIFIAMVLLFDGAPRLARRCLRPCRRPPRARSGSAPRSWSIRRPASAIAAFCAGSAAPTRSSFPCSLATIVEVRRMFLAWKKFHKFDASIWEFSAAVCALLPNVSENARNSASTAISSATFLFRFLLPSWPWPPPCLSCSILCSTSCCTACTP